MSVWLDLKAIVEKTRRWCHETLSFGDRNFLPKTVICWWTSRLISVNLIIERPLLMILVMASDCHGAVTDPESTWIRSPTNLSSLMTPWGTPSRRIVSPSHPFLQSFLLPWVNIHKPLVALASLLPLLSFFQVVRGATLYLICLFVILSIWSALAHLSPTQKLQKTLNLCQAFAHKCLNSHQNSSLKLFLIFQQFRYLHCKLLIRFSLQALSSMVTFWEPSLRPVVPCERYFFSKPGNALKSVLFMVRGPAVKIT